MNKSLIGVVTLVAAACMQAAPAPSSEAANAARILAASPLRFEPAAGDRFVTRGLKFSSSLEANHMDLRTREQSMRVTFDHASTKPQLQGGTPLPTKTSVLKGNDRAKWRSGIANYIDVRANNLYPGIDLKYYGNGGDLEYDLIVKPGANPKQIRLRIDGVKPVLDPDGNLSAAFMQKHPVAYQMGADGTRIAVASRYSKNSDGTFSFRLGRYDHTRELVIDPTLTYSAFVAGTSQDTAKAIGHDGRGLLYVGGFTISTDFAIDPVAGIMPGDPQQANNAGGYDLFFAQIDPVAQQVNYAAYLGGSLDDIMNDMYVDQNGLCYATGYTQSTNFPMTGNAYQSTLTGKSDAFVVIYNLQAPIGSQLVYSTYLGGGTAVAGNGVVADGKGRVFIVGTTNSSELPVVNGLPQGLNGSSDAFVSAFDPSQTSPASTLFYSTFIGGSSFELGNAITMAPDGTLWIAGETLSNDFPLQGNSLQNSTAGEGDAFVVQLDWTQGSNGELYGTYLGGSGLDAAQKIAVDGLGRIVVAGYTLSSDVPFAGGYQPVNKGAGDCFITVLNPYATGNMPQLVYSTYYGGSGAEIPTALRADSKGVIYVTGFTGSADLPITRNALGNVRAGGQDGFVIKLDPGATSSQALLYGSYVASTGNQIPYGIDIDKSGNIYLAGPTSGGIFDTLGGAAKPNAIGNVDAFIFGFNPSN